MIINKYACWIAIYRNAEVEIIPEGQLHRNEYNTVDQAQSVDHQYACHDKLWVYSWKL